MNHTLRHRVRSVLVQVLVLVVTLSVLTATVPQFQGVAALYSTLSNFTLLGLLALAVATTMIVGELDLSVASLATLAGALAVRWSELGLVPAILLSTVAVTLIGMAQGYVIQRFRVNSLVFTLTTSIIIAGSAWILTGNKPLPLGDYTISDPLYIRWWVLSPDSAVALLAFLIVGLFLADTRWGRELYAIGGARTEAIAAGVSERRAIVTAFALSGVCSALAGSLASIKSGSATPDGYSSLLLTAVAAALIGGVGIKGGQGGVIHVVLGVATLGALSAALGMNGSKTHVTQLLTGSLLFAVVGLEYLLATLYKRQSPRRQSRHSVGAAS